MSKTPLFAAKIRTIRDITGDIREFTLVPAEGARSFTPGAHLEIEVLIEGGTDRRAYSLIGLPDGQSYRIAVKRRKDSRGGSAYMHSLKAGDSVHISAPKSSFALDFGASDYLLIAGGIGITPLIGMAEQLARRGETFRLAYAAQSEADFAYLDMLEAITPVSTFIRKEGRPLDLAGEFARLAPDAFVAICGPIGMLGEARRLWAEAGRPVANLRWETFGSSGHLPSEAFRVKIPRHGLEIIVPQDKSLLDALGAAGVDVIHECRKGECGLCAMEVLEVDGRIDHRDVFFSDHQHAENRQICACVSRVSGTVTLDTDFRPDAI